ncbi:cellulase N-terminal Ig-like domain-containing protein [Pseudomonas saliphila]|uniref:cellulase N-terminal Ig-like domain-containing protein n=1 Tax=Pseudomonas saliphila TaxID=2586906 RepID=UPI0019D55DDE|nr:cellulase N-terminal Ig-like domain-containing protein [Pseudomonas saliphila]
MSATRTTPFRQTLIAAALVCASAGAAVAETGNPRVNQLGYIPAGPKIAVYATNSNAPLAWQLRRGDTVLASGQTNPFGHDGASGENLHHIDLSDFDQPSDNLTLHVGGDQSHPLRSTRISSVVCSTTH